MGDVPTSQGVVDKKPTFFTVGRSHSLNWNSWIRQFHRWLSIVFTVTVIANVIALSQGKGAPPNWLTYSPLLPLALLLLTGLYLFALPYATRWRSESGRSA